MQPTLPIPVSQTDHPLYREKIRKFFSLFDALPLSPAFPLDDPAQLPEYDLVVVGSDEVWNLFHPWYGGHKIFYGEGIPADRLVAYAASFGNYDASWQLGQSWIERLKNFEHISVRDENSQSIIKTALDIEVPMVLDPCLQFPLEPAARGLEHLDKPYLAVYGHNFSSTFIDETKKVARRKNYKTISIGYRNDWADEQWITADPHDFVHFIRNCSGLVTNFFHGCVFALQNERPFVCETSPYRKNKVEGLMKKIGGEKYLLSDETSSRVFEARLNEEIDPSILTRIQELRSSSNNFLDGALGAKQFKRA